VIQKTKRVWFFYPERVWLLTYWTHPSIPVLTRLFETVVFGGMIFLFSDTSDLLRSVGFVRSCLLPHGMARKSFLCLLLIMELLALGFCYCVSSRSIRHILNSNCSLQIFTCYIFCNLVSRLYAGSLGCVYDW